MNDSSVKEHVDALRQADPDRHELVRQVRGMVRVVAPDVAERVIYGGIMFTAPAPNGRGG